MNWFSSSQENACMVCFRKLHYLIVVNQIFFQFCLRENENITIMFQWFKLFWKKINKFIESTTELTQPLKKKKSDRIDNATDKSQGNHLEWVPSTMMEAGELSSKLGSMFLFFKLARKIYTCISLASNCIYRDKPVRVQSLLMENPFKQRVKEWYEK